MRTWDYYANCTSNEQVGHISYNAHPLRRVMRKVAINRDTSETQISIDLNLDGTGETEFDTGLPFLEHMLDQIGRHGMIDLTIKAKATYISMIIIQLKILAFL